MAGHPRRLPRAEDVLENAQDAFIATDAENRVIAWNAEAERVFGWDREEALGRDAAELVIPERNREAYRNAVASFLAAGEGPLLDRRIRVLGLDRRGREFPCELTVTPLEVDGHCTFNAFARDISDRVRADRYRDAQLALTRVISSGAALDDLLAEALGGLCGSLGWDGGEILLLDEGEGVLRRTASWTSAGFETPEFDRISSGFAFGPSVGIPGRVLETGEPVWIPDVGAAHDLPRAAAAAADGVRSSLAFPITIDRNVVGAVALLSRNLRRPDDELLDMLLSIGSQIGQLVDRKGREKALAHRTLHDELTDLPNRALFMDRLAVALSRREAEVAVLHVDVDRFKHVNERFGHAGGDELLRNVARRLRDAIRPSDTVARLGGDDFVVLCDALPGSEEAETIAGRIGNSVSVPCRVADGEVHPRVSIGIALGAADTDPPSLMHDAEAAMYRAKARGGGTYELFDRATGLMSSTRLDIENDLRRAIVSDELVVFYQPQIELATGNLSGFEALARWQHPTRGLLGPGEFIPVAEETGLIVALGTHVAEKAAAQLAQWRELSGRDDMHMAVNLSPRQFAQTDLTDFVEQVVAGAGIRPQCLCLEVTESTLMENEHASGALRSLHDLGFQIAIDDFGVGFSSLSRLKRFLPAAYLKIDKSFVESAATDPNDGSIVATIVLLGQSLGMRVIAEGVETQAQARLLRGLGCDIGQGFHFGAPQPPAQLEGLVRAARPRARG